MSAIIVCNGRIEDYSCYKKYFEKAEFVVCADGGGSHIRKFGVRPDVLLGDFDSIAEKDFDYLKNEGVEILKYPSQKDMTDTEIAVELAIEKGHKSIIIIGGLGTRSDHSLANVFMLKKMLDKDVRGCIVDEYNEITVIRDRIQLEREEGFNITLLPLTEKVEGITTRGLYYPLDNATLEMGSSWGVSNEFAAEAADISIRSGLLLVVKSRD